MKEAPPGSDSSAGRELATGGGEEPAVQHTMHEPQPRVHVHEETRTIVVADDVEDGSTDREPTRKLEPYTATRAESTVVIRDRRAVRELQRTGVKKRGLSSAFLWAAAGLAAFGLGGALAVFTAKRDNPPEPQAITATPPAPAAEPPAPAPEPEPPAVAEPVVEPAREGTSDVPAVNAAELPVEGEPAKKPARKTSANRTDATAPSAPKPAATLVPKAEIPSGI